MNNLVYLWLVIALLLALFEMSSPGLFFFLSFSIGACVSAIFAFFEYSLVLQCITFLLTTMIVLFFLKQWVANYMQKSHPNHRTNTHALQGKRALVIKAIELNAVGEVKIGGEIWSARTTYNNTISIGEYVEVVDIRGAHVVVTPALKK